MSQIRVNIPRGIRAGKPYSILRSAVRRFLCLPPWLAMVCIYLPFCLLRIACAFYAASTPVIMPDSALYMHLSRSIMEKGALLFRGQPIRYEHILYPLLLSPLQLLPQSVSLFRGIQVFNVLVMHLAVFPVYGLARAVLRSHRKALLCAVFTMLMPDFFITEHIMTESIAFPLILAACYAFYKTYDSPFRLKTALLWGGLGFLLCALKPGYVALPACFFALLVWEGLHKRSLERLYQALAGLLLLLSFLGLYALLLQWGLRMSPRQSTLYGTQTHPLTWDHLLQTLNGLFMYGAYVPLAFGFFTLYLPAAQLGAWEGKDRHLLKLCLFSMLAIAAGTVYVIYYDELNGGDPYAARIHVRYISAFLPVLMMYALSPALKGKRLNTSLFLLLSFSLLCLVFLNGASLLSGYDYPVDAILLTAASAKTQGFDGRLLWPIFAAVFLLAMAYRLIRYGYGTFERRMLFAFLTFAFVFNGALSVFVNRHHIDSVYPKDSYEAVTVAGVEGSLGVVRDGGCFWPEAAELDVASRCGIPVVELDDLMELMNPDGSISAFTPKAYWQENAVNAVPNIEKLILTNEILNSVMLSKEAQAGAVSTANGGYCVLPAAKGQPIFHSGLSGLKEGWVAKGSRFTVFDEQLRAQETITLQLQVSPGEGQAQLILCLDGQEQAFVLTGGLQWIAAVFKAQSPDQALAITLDIGESSVFVKTYLIS